MGVLIRLFFSSPLGAGKERTVPKTYLLLGCPCHCEDLHFVQEKGKRKLAPLQELFRNEMRERTQGSGSFSFLPLVCSYLCECACTCMPTCTREQRKLRLTILQTLHVGGVFSKRTLHHARDVREGAGQTLLAQRVVIFWKVRWVSLGVAHGKQGSQPREGAVLGKPGGTYME